MTATPSPDSLWRRALVQRLAEVYAEDRRVDSVLVSGSTARGDADRYSDIELAVFWREAPSEEDRRRAAARTGADLHRLHAFDPDCGVWADDLFAGRAAADEPKSGVLVEVGHTLVDYVDQVLHSVLLEADADEEKHNLVAGILDGIPLRPSARLEDWQRRAADYPRQLAEAVVRRHAQIDHFWRSEMWLARGDNRMMLYDMFVQVEKKLLHVLLGLNRVYYFGFKWLGTLDARLRYKPPDLLPRLRQVYQDPPEQAVTGLASLVEETYDLVEAHLPAVDVNRLRAIFRYRRPAWDEPPPWSGN